MTITPTDATTATARTAVDEELSTRRLNIMRFGYAFMGVGLVIVKWPLLIQDAASVPLMDPSSGQGPPTTRSEVSRRE
jgi:hypothetical protein